MLLAVFRSSAAVPFDLMKVIICHNIPSIETRFFKVPVLFPNFSITQSEEEEEEEEEEAVERVEDIFKSPLDASVRRVRTNGVLAIVILARSETFLSLPYKLSDG